MIARTVRPAAGTASPTRIDAVEAARAALSGRAQRLAKTADGNVEAIRVLMIAFRSGRDSRTTCLNQLRHLGFCGPDDLRERFRGVTVGALAGDRRRRCARTRLVTRSCTPPSWPCRPSGAACSTSTPTAPASTTSSPQLVTATAPSLLALHGVGTHTAALLLVAAGDNAERITSEAAFAHLCGVAPIHASSGKTIRHRLNRGGNRQANHALWRIVFTRMGSDPRTRAYVERRTLEGRSKPEIMRVLKRYVAREVYRHLPRA